MPGDHHYAVNDDAEVIPNDFNLNIPDVFLRELNNNSFVLCPDVINFNEERKAGYWMPAQRDYPPSFLSATPSPQSVSSPENSLAVSHKDDFYGEKGKKFDLLAVSMAMADEIDHQTTASKRRCSDATAPPLAKKARKRSEDDPELRNLTPDERRLQKHLNRQMKNVEPGTIKSRLIETKREQLSRLKLVQELREYNRRNGLNALLLHPLKGTELPDNHRVDGEMIIVDDSETPFQCGYGGCSYASNRRNNLQRHLDTMHVILDKPVRCCSSEFFMKFSYRAHIKEKHKNDGYYCEVDACDKHFQRKALLDRHVRSHDPGNGYVCSTCDYKTHHKSNMERHTRIHPEARCLDERGRKLLGYAVVKDTLFLKRPETEPQRREEEETWSDRRSVDWGVGLTFSDEKLEALLPDLLNMDVSSPNVIVENQPVIINHGEYSCENDLVKIKIENF